MNGTEAEVGLRTGENGSDGNRKMLSDGLKSPLKYYAWQRSPWATGISTNRGASFEATSPTRSAQIASGPMARASAHQPLQRQSWNDKDDVPADPNRPGAAYIELCKNSPTGIGGRGSSPKILSFSGKNQDGICLSLASSGRSASPLFDARAPS